MTQPSTLMHQLFRAKYFPNSNFMESMLGPPPSYTWHGILDARLILKEGCWWRVRMGDGINLWSDYWLPKTRKLSMYKPFKSGLLTFKHVSDIINQTSHGWDMAIINQLFPPQIGANILKLALPIIPTRDAIIWEGEKRDAYMVKSGYGVRQLEKKRVGDNSGCNSHDPLWRKIWSLKLPNKIKFFAWRATTYSLPTREKLMHWNIQIELGCPFYNYPLEDLYHALFTCTEVSLIWSQFLQGYPIGPVTQSVYSIMQVCTHQSSKVLEHFIVIGWGFWLRRNKKIFEDFTTHPQDVALQAIWWKP